MTFKITDSPSAIPAACIFCPTSVRKWYIDTEYDIEYHGALYICNFCLQEMAGIAGYITPEHAETLKTINANLEDENITLQGRLKALENSLGALLDSGYHNPSLTNSDGDSDLGFEVDEQELLNPDDNVGTGEGETSESFDDEGMGELLPDVGDEFEFDLDLKF